MDGAGTRITIRFGYYMVIYCGLTLGPQGSDVKHTTRFWALCRRLRQRQTYGFATDSVVFVEIKRKERGSMSLQCVIWIAAASDQWTKNSFGMRENQRTEELDVICVTCFVTTYLL